MRQFIPTLFRFPSLIKGVDAAIPLVKIPHRNKSTSVIRSPGTMLSSQTHLEQVNIYRQQRRALDQLLEQFWQASEVKCKRKDYSRALSDYQTIISLMDEEEIDNLTNRQKDILAKAYVELARIISIRSIEESNLALNYLNTALDLIPNMQKAIELKQSILADQSISPVHLNEHQAK